MQLCAFVTLAATETVTEHYLLSKSERKLSKSK